MRVIDDGIELTCDEVRYSRATGIAWLVGNVAAWDSTSTLHADSLYYNRNTLRAEAFGKVRITNRDEGFAVTGNHGFYFRDRGEGIIDQNPYLTVDPEGRQRDIYVGALLQAEPPDPALLEQDSIGVWLVTSGETASARDWYLSPVQGAWLDDLERTVEPRFVGEDGLTKVYCFGRCP